MRFKLDENLSHSVAGLFRSAGHDAMTVREQHLQSAPDERIFDVASRERRTLVTLDRDLGQVLRFPPEASAGIIVIDVGSRASHQGLLNRTRELLVLLETRSPDGALWIVEPGRVRIYLAKDDE